MEPEVKIEKKVEKPVQLEEEDFDSLLSNKQERKSELVSSADFPSLSGDGVAPPPGLIGAGAYADRLESTLRDQDFPSLQSPVTASRGVAEPKQNVQWRNSNSNGGNRKKKKQQRKKNVIFSIG